MTDPDIVSLREYIESRLQAIKDTSESQLTSLKETMAVSDRTLDHRLAQMNELRDQINSERAEYVRRVDCESQHKMLDADVRMLRESKAALDGKASITVVYVTGMLSMISLLVAIVGLLRSFM